MNRAGILAGGTLVTALLLGIGSGLSAAAEDCAIPTPPGVPCLLPSATPTPSESPTASPSASPDVTAEPQPTAEPTVSSGPVLPPVEVVQPAFPVSVPVGVASSPAAAPELPQAPQPATPQLVSSVFPASVSGPFAILVAGLLGTSLLVTALATAGRASVAGHRARRRRLGGLAQAVLTMAASRDLEAAPLPTSPPAPSGGSAMSETRRWRLFAGIGLLLLAAVVGLIGWYKVSEEPALNFEMSVMFSAGVTAMILAVAGGALLVAEQMRTDDTRLDDMEDAIRSLVLAMAPAIERPARLREEGEPEAAAPPKRTRTPRRS